MVLAGRPLQGPPARLRRHRRGLARLRPRRPPRLLHRQRLADRGRPGHREGKERALPPEGGRDLRGRHRRRRCGRRGRVGGRGLRGRLRRRRLARHPGHQLRAQRALPQSRRRTLRERGRRGGARVPGLEHRRGLVRRRRGRRPRRLHRRLHRQLAGADPGREAHPAVARHGQGGGGTVRPRRGRRPLLPQRRRPFRRRHHGGGDGGQGAGLRLLGPGRGLRPRRGPRRLRGQRLRPELPLPERGRRHLPGGGHLDRLRPRRERRGPGQHGGGGGRRHRQRGARHLREPLLRGLLHPVAGPRGRALRGRLAQERGRSRRPTRPWPGAPPSPTSTTTGTSRSPS